MIESYAAVGGNCIHFGTLPSKSFRESVYRYSLSSHGVFGQEKGKKTLPEMKRLLSRKNRVVSNEAKIVFDQINRNKIKLVHGHAQFVALHEIEVQSKKGKVVYSGEKIFIATGARPVSPAHLPVDGKLILDSNTVLELKKVPRTMVVLGAGIIGCEFASMFSTAGTKVYLIDKRKEILATVDREIVNHLSERFAHMGLEVILGAEASKVERKKSKSKASGCVIHLSNGKKISTETVLVAQGRLGNTEDLGLEKVGVNRDERGLIHVDQYLRTNIPHIYAMGDVIGSPALASTSMEQGRIACCHAFSLLEESECVMPAIFPYGIYTIPEISCVGLSEEQAKAQKLDFVIGKSFYRELARGQIVGDRWGMLKMLVDRKTRKVLGLHIVGDAASNLIHVGQAVMQLNGTVDYFVKTVFNYPTLAEAYKIAALNIYNQIKGHKSSPR